MANLTFSDKKKLESFLGMGGGYVLNFTNSEFREFVKDAINIDIYSAKYENQSNSKANLLRRFWEIESDAKVAQLLECFVEYYKTFICQDDSPDENIQGCDECIRIAQRLRANHSIGDIEIIKGDEESADFNKLATSIREDITNDKPDVAIDRLHTYMGVYCRNLCDKRGIPYDNFTPLNSIFGCYVKHIRDNKLVESEMTLRILNTSISVLEYFNDVRNNKSFAHPNNLLNYDESFLIFKYISNLLVFIDALEIKIEADIAATKKKGAAMKAEHDLLYGELPF
ncbi:MAG: hypothetical protein EOO43_25255 [Flavobacterium sp.]|nr:MAG: hypothetical protein EOO43_25255 [Flavobacterium sp.]